MRIDHGADDLEESEGATTSCDVCCSEGNATFSWSGKEVDAIQLVGDDRTSSTSNKSDRGHDDTG